MSRSAWAWCGLGCVIAAAGCSENSTMFGTGTGETGGTGVDGASTGATGGQGGTGMGGGAPVGGGGMGPVHLFDCSAPDGATGTLKLTLVRDELVAPVLATHAPMDADRLFVVEQTGQVRMLRNGEYTLFLDVEGDDDKVVAGAERGLLGLAFHPNYADNGRFWVHGNVPFAVDLS